MFIAGSVFGMMLFFTLVTILKHKQDPAPIKPYAPPIIANIWKDKAGEYRWKVGFEVQGTLDEVDWKCDSTEGFDTEADAFCNMEVFVCRSYEPTLIKLGEQENAE